MGDCKNNVARSLMVVCAKLGMNFTACGPLDCMPAQDVLEACKPIAAENGCTITLTQSVEEACTGADVIYTDVWVSMGEPDEVWAKRIRDLLPYRITRKLMETAGPEAVFMHCLPAYHDKKTTVGREVCEKFGLDCLEVTDEVFESPQSIVFQQAENRMHTIKAVMAATL